MSEYVIDFLIIVVVVMAIATVGYGLWNAGDGASINRGTTQGRRCAMKVYLVYWTNNEPYEDYYESVEKAFSTYDKAVEFIESQGYKLREERGRWEIAHDIVRWDAIEDDGFGTVYSMWVREMEVSE